MARRILFPILRMKGYGISRSVEDESLYSLWWATLVNDEEEILAEVSWSKLWNFIDSQDGNWENLSQFFYGMSLEDAKTTFLFAEIYA